MSKKTTTVRVQPRQQTLRITVSHQAHYDDYDNTGPGYYAWVGEPGEQSDFAIGPCETEERARELARQNIQRVYGAIL